ncbi:MAG: DNA alkylation repair protein [Candidatus Micrarchaeota archaeon]
MEYSAIIQQMKSQYNPRNIEGMARFGINPKNNYGSSIPFLRSLAKKIGKNHSLALKLWASGIHDARILAGFIDEPAKVTEKQLEDWALDFDSWDVCDLVCSGLFDQTRFAWRKAVEWTKRKEEFVKRAGFVLMAALSVHDKNAKDADFEKFFPIIKREAKDERNFVRKAVNWALRQIGKRNSKLNKKALATAREIRTLDSKSARWIAADAIRELESEAVKRRLKNR